MKHAIPAATMNSLITSGARNGEPSPNFRTITREGNNTSMPQRSVGAKCPQSLRALSLRSTLRHKRSGSARLHHAKRLGYEHFDRSRHTGARLDRLARTHLDRPVSGGCDLFGGRDDDSIRSRDRLAARPRITAATPAAEAVQIERNACGREISFSMWCWLRSIEHDLVVPPEPLEEGPGGG